MEIVQTMEQAPGAEVIDVNLPRELAPPPRSRTVQDTSSRPDGRAVGDHDLAIRVARLPHGRAVGSAVAGSDGALVWESLWDEDHFRRGFDPPPALAPPVRLPGVCASLISLWCDNYFHWIFNSLPRLAVLNASGIEYDHLIVPEKMNQFHYDTLEILGVPRNMLVPFTGGHVQPDVLVWASPVAPINEPSRFLLDWVRDSLAESAADRLPERRLYLSRAGTSRKVANERELFAALEPHGFEFVEPGSLPFREQVRLFSQARVAVGPHGANFAGGIFSPRLTALEFFQPAHVNWSLCSILSGVGHEHWHIHCPSVRALGQRRFRDMRVPVDLVLETLSRMDTGSA